MSLSILRNALQVVMVLLVSATALLGQGEAVNARLTGAVLDTENKSVPEARITLANPSAGFARHFVTGLDGQYTFTMIPPGAYQLKVEKAGFATHVQSNVVLAVGQSSTLDLKLEVGPVSETIEVAADAPLLNTGNASIGLEISGKQVVELPLNIRNVYNLVTLNSSVNNATQYQGLT